MCGCRKNKAGSSLVAGGGSGNYSYQVTLPSGEEKTYLTPLEAKMAIRKEGGGTILRVDA